MAKSRKDCLTEIAERSGKSREEVGDALDEILDRADGFESDGMGRDEAYGPRRVPAGSRRSVRPRAPRRHSRHAQGKLAASLL
jgi:hypothetical protein